MNTTYSKVVFNDQQPDTTTAIKLNRLRDDLSTAIGTGTGTGTGDMTKAVYDVNNNGIVDTCDALAWGKITGAPSAFTPTTHAPTHLDNGSDPIAVVTSVRTGLCPTLNGNAATYLNGIGTYTAVSGSVNPGTWTTLTLATGWTTKITPQYRVEVNGAVSMVYCRGAVTQASGAAALAFTFPSGAIPSVVRMVTLAGQQTEGQTLNHVQIDTSGNVTVTAVVRAVFTWPSTSTAQDVYLDSMFFSL